MRSTEPDEFVFEGGTHNSYFFASHRDVIYQVKFKPGFYLFDLPPNVAKNMYELVIAVAYEPRAQPPLLDLQTPVTIAAIVEDFLKKREQIAVYILDDSDGRAQARQRKFDHWFRHFKGVLYLKYDLTFGRSDGRVYFTSLIYRHDNPLKFVILEAFTKLADGYNEGKQQSREKRLPIQAESHGQPPKPTPPRFSRTRYPAAFSKAVQHRPGHDGPGFTGGLFPKNRG